MPEPSKVEYVPVAALEAERGKVVREIVEAIRERYIDTWQGIKCSDFRDAADFIEERFGAALSVPARKDEFIECPVCDGTGSPDHNDPEQEAYCPDTE